MKSKLCVKQVDILPGGYNVSYSGRIRKADIDSLDALCSEISYLGSDVEQFEAQYKNIIEHYNKLVKEIL